MFEDLRGPKPEPYPGGKGVICDIAPVPAAYAENNILAGVKYTIPTMRAGARAAEF